MFVKIFGHSIALFLLLALSPSLCEAGTYKDAKNIFSTLLSSDNYNPNVRPLQDQEDTLYVYITFGILSIVAVSDVDQSFKCNGLMAMYWIDEILHWNESEHGQVKSISPKMSEVFTPRLNLMNTMGDRDVFIEEFSPVSVHSSGFTSWIPGSIFDVFCKLDLSNYPFDEQLCNIEMILMNFNLSELQFKSIFDKATTDFYVENEEWELLDSTVISNATKVSDIYIPAVLVNFRLKRKPTFLIINVLLPIVLLSLMNILVFLIPVESGEKISYGITVLLALAVFMSIVSGTLPKSSGTMPLMVSYMFGLLILSFLTVVDCIVIVRLHLNEEQEEEKAQPKTDITKTPAIPLTRVGDGGRIPSPMGNDVRFFPAERRSDYRHVEPTAVTSSVSSSSSSYSSLKGNRSKLFVKRLDMISLIVFGLVWLGMTLWFLIKVAL
ncbi:hypothetical protein RRG08_029027 [Elysia crispata]|uniref:Uncharacterized protein n=1 Tax=Elysia crispata TaxID=231223 RepID=A0AAE1AJD6_9GAST|nr:hypothetical protein RRG08_029027 [Elysia crispata]